MQPVFLGYTARRRRPNRPGWVPESVEEVCSATDCQAESPEALRQSPEWYEHNGLLPSEAPVEKAAAESGDNPYILYAYFAYPVWFDADGPHHGLHTALNPPNQAPDLALYTRLGYDLLEVMADYGVWGCSPLSCNGMAREIPVNRFCLLDSLEDALEVGRRFGLDPPEPGEYVVVEVWRRD